MRHRLLVRSGLIAVLGVAMVLPVGSAFAATTVGGEPDATISTSVNDDAFIAGQSVSITAPITGELFAAGRTVTISNRPDRSVVAAGETVNIPKGAGYNAYVGGQTVTLAGEFGHDVYAAGTTVVIDPSAHIHGSLFAAGSTVTIHGAIDGQVRVSGQTVASDAVIGRDAFIDAAALSFSGGSVGGDLRYSSRGIAAGLDKVSVKGSTVHEAEPASAATSSAGPSEHLVNGPAGTIFDAFLAFLTMVLVGGLIVLVSPKRLAEIADAVTSTWAASFLAGIVLLIVAPLVSGIALATLIGWPVAFVIGFLYVTVLMVSSFVAPIILGMLFVRPGKNEQPWRALLLGSAIVAITVALPVVGWMPSLALFVGLTLPVFGASLRWIWETLRA